MGWTRRRRKIPASTKAALWGAGIGLAAAGGWAAWRALQRAHERDARLQRGKRIVVVGGGFAGAAAAQELARLLPNEADAEITLVDANDFLLFTPMLTEVAGGQVAANHIVQPLRSLSSRVRFVRGRAESIDAHRREVVVVAGGPDGIAADRHTLQADHLLIALGSVPSFHHIPGIEDHAFTVKSIEDATAIRNRILGLLERADEEPDETLRREMLTVVVGGGGYTGVEVMAAINDLLRETADQYSRVRLREVRTILVVPEDRLLMELNTPRLAGYARRKLQERGVEIRLKTSIKSASETEVVLDSGDTIRTRLLIWAAGVAPAPEVAAIDCAHGKHGGIVTDECLAVPDRPGVWAVGDCAEIPQPNGKGSYAPTAQNATREGAQAGRNIVATLRDEPPQPFVYTPIGELALVGRRTGVAEVYGIGVEGFLAWMMWRAVYLLKTPGASQRIHILLDWLLDVMFGSPVAALPSARHIDAMPEQQVTTGKQEAEAKPA